MVKAKITSTSTELVWLVSKVAVYWHLKQKEEKVRISFRSRSILYLQDQVGQGKDSGSLKLWVWQFDFLWGQQ